MKEKIDIRRGAEIDREPMNFDFDAKAELTPERKRKIVDAISRADVSVGIGIGFVHDCYLQLRKIDPIFARGIMGRPDWFVLWEKSAELLSQDYQRGELGYIVNRAADLHKIRGDWYMALVRREMLNSERITNHVVNTFISSVDEAFSVGDLESVVELQDVPFALTSTTPQKLGTPTMDELKTKMNFESLKPKIAATLLERIHVKNERIFWPGIIFSAVNLLRLDPEWFDKEIASHLKTRNAIQGVKSWIDEYDPLKSSAARDYLALLNNLSILSAHFGTSVAIGPDKMPLPETRTY